MLEGKRAEMRVVLKGKNNHAPGTFSKKPA
jgi:hypothetical protein